MIHNINDSNIIHWAFPHPVTVVQTQLDYGLLLRRLASLFAARAHAAPQAASRPLWLACNCSQRVPSLAEPSLRGHDGHGASDFAWRLHLLLYLFGRPRYLGARYLGARRDTIPYRGGVLG